MSGTGPAIQGDREDVAAMRRELEELKQIMREGLAKPAPRKKRKA